MSSSFLCRAGSRAKCSGSTITWQVEQAIALAGALQRLAVILRHFEQAQARLGLHFMPVAPVRAQQR